jgi:hypothetical protein
MPLSTFSIRDVSGRQLRIEAAEVIPLQPQHSSLDRSLRQRIQQVYRALGDVILGSNGAGKSIEEFEQSFLAGDEPGKDVIVWEAIAGTLEKARAMLRAEEYDRTALYARLVFMICGSLTEEERAEELTKKLELCFDSCLRSSVEAANRSAERHIVVCRACYMKIATLGGRFCPRCGRQICFNKI